MDFDIGTRRDFAAVLMREDARAAFAAIGGWLMRMMMLAH